MQNLGGGKKKEEEEEEEGHKKPREWLEGRNAWGGRHTQMASRRRTFSGPSKPGGDNKQSLESGKQWKQRQSGDNK